MPPFFIVHTMPLRYIKFILSFCILATTMACYFPGLSGSFIFDDGVNIINNPQIRIEELSLSSLGQAATSSDAGALQRPISMMSFALDYYVSGMDSHRFKMTNLGIHLLNGVLIYLLTKLLLELYLKIQRPLQGTRHVDWVALAVSAIWLLHPFNLTCVLYVVQRMTSLSAFFSLVGLILYLHGRERLVNGQRSGWFAIATALLVATPLATLCKENGALLPFLILATEATLLRWHTADPASRRLLKIIVGLSVAIPVLLGLYYVWAHPGAVTGGYWIRDFSLSERLMTEARVMWFYVHMILLPNMNMMGLHHDDIVISNSLLSPVWTLLSLLGLFLVAAGVFVLRNKHPIIAFGLAFFLVGHALESTVLPLEIAFEHRNYLPMLGILLVLTYYAFTPEFHAPSLRWRRVSFIALVILFGGLTAMRASQWGDPLQMRMLEVERHPLSVRANIDLANLFDNMPARSNEEAVYYYNKALFHYQQAADVSPLNCSGLFGLLVVNAERGLAIDSALVETLTQRLTTIPFNPPNINALIGTARCINSGRCSVSPKVVNMLYRASLTNPTLTGKYRDQVVFEFSEVVSKIQHETQ